MLKKIFYVMVLLIQILSLFAEDTNPYQYYMWNSPYGPLSVHYKEEGIGDDHLLLVHGFGSNSYTWHELVNPLQSAGYHVWSIDLIGAGLSSKPLHVPYGFNLFAAQIQDFCQAKGIKQATVIGSSMGGGIALSLTLADPGLVRNLVLIDPLGFPVDLPIRYKIGKTVGTYGKLLVGSAAVRYELGNIMYNPKLITDEQVEAYTSPLNMEGGAEALLLLLQSYDDHAIEKMVKRYPEIKIPMLIIFGSEDKLIPINHYYRFLKEFPQAKGVLIPGCGHIPQEECPKQVLEVLLPFLNQHTNSLAK